MSRPVRKLSISLPQDLFAAMRAAVETGRYTSVSEVVRDALRVWHVDEPLGDRVAGLTPGHLLDVELLASVRAFTRLAVRGSIRQRHVTVAVRFERTLPWGMSLDDSRQALAGKLSLDWRRTVQVVDFDAIDDLRGWTVVYDPLPAAAASDTDSSSTS